jgi:hypothetical protein
MVVDFSCESGAALLERRSQYSTNQLREVCFARPVFARRVDQRIECGRAGWRDACPHDLVHDVDRFAELLGWLGDLKRRPPACARASVRHQIKHSLRCVGERFCDRLRPAGEDGQLLDVERRRYWRVDLQRW